MIVRKVLGSMKAALFDSSSVQRRITLTAQRFVFSSLTLTSVSSERIPDPANTACLASSMAARFSSVLVAARFTDTDEERVSRTEP